MSSSTNVAVSAVSAVSAVTAVTAVHSIIYLGMDVHKESITIAVLPEGAKTPTRLDRLPNDLPKLKKWLERVARDGEIRACYEASGAGYVLHRAMKEWGYASEVIAPSLIPKRPGVQRKHDKRDAADLARFYRAGELTAVRIPSETDERVRDVVRCRETFQKEILKSRHYILKFLARRGFVRQQGQTPSVIVHAWKAQQRLHQRFNHLSYRKRPQIAVVAVARELVGFLWAVMQDVAPIEQQAA